VVVRVIAEGEDGPDPAVLAWQQAEISYLEELLKLAQTQPRRPSRVVTLHIDLVARRQDLDR
jgi:hypothetical protein